MRKAVIISGFLDGLSDNIIPFLDMDTDVCVHTWDTYENRRWVEKLKRYKKYCNNIEIVSERPTTIEKLLSYFYSTCKAYSLVDTDCSYIIKFKPNIDTPSIPFVGDISRYFIKASVQCRPLLDDTVIEDCIFGKVYYRTLDERIFSGTKLVFDKLFPIFDINIQAEASVLNDELKEKYGDNYEGSIFWTEWMERRGIKIIEDTDLIIANNIQI